MVANSKSFHSVGFRHWRSEIASAFAFVILCLPLACAQAPGIVAKLDVVAWGDSISGLSFSKENTGETFTALAFRYSKPITYRGASLVVFHQHSATGSTEPQAIELADSKDHESRPLTIARPSGSGEQSAQPKKGLALQLEKLRKEQPSAVALARIPAGCTRATVLLAPYGDGTFQAMVVDDNPTKLPPGKLRVHNLSPYPIAMRFNGRGAPKELKLNENTIVDAPGGQVIYELAYKLGKEWNFQENNILPVTSKEQAQMIILRSDNRFFLSSDGATGGFLQNVVLRRTP